MNEEIRQIVEELDRPVRRNNQRHVDIRGLDETWQADLVDTSAYKSYNKGYQYLLTVIDIFSKYAWAIPTKSKSGKDVTEAMMVILNETKVPKRLHVNRGKEFYNKDFEGLMKQHHSKIKHRTIKMKPVDVSLANEKKLFDSIYKKLKVVKMKKKNKFRVGDKVRISKYKHIFEKGHTPNWTTDIFTVSEVTNTHLVTHKLTDYPNQSIERGFYEKELTTVLYPDVYLVEKY
ncbi:uncharacterized protein [Chelonus insularis]|uniref:uncharacterized protein n=1 Tax=Chelonus insularis TaxID=460826 RepID=UPI00158CFED4|nr:uncharacterized protein LOC118066130 [Chelonus insularis]